jgi:hypothetical protein
MSTPRLENVRSFAGLRIAWDAGNLPIDPIAPVLPLELEQEPAAGPRRPPELTVTAQLTTSPAPDPRTRGALPAIYHGQTRCFLEGQELVLWDGASLLRISADGRAIHADVHASSLDHVFHFSSVSVMMALLLALRHRGLFHLHASAATWPSGETWVIPGESGSGKSTLALAAWSAGARWSSDDALLVRAAPDGAPELCAWSRPVRLTSQTAAAFPALRAQLTACPPGSARDHELDPRSAFPGRAQAVVRAPLTLLCPQFRAELASTLVPLAAADAFGRLLHASAWVASEHLPHRREQLDLLSRLVDHARAYELRMGCRILQAPDAAIAELHALLAARHSA